MLADRRDLEIVDQADAAGRRAAGVDVVITVPADATARALLPPSVDGDPERSVLAVTIAGTRVMLFEIHPRPPALENPSPDALVAAIRSAVAEWRDEG